MTESIENKLTNCFDTKKQTIAYLQLYALHEKIYTESSDAKTKENNFQPHDAYEMFIFFLRLIAIPENNLNLCTL